MATAATYPQPVDVPPERRKAAIVALLLVLGIYLPTSVNGDLSKLWFGIDYLVCFGLFLPLVLRASRFPSVPICISLLSIVPLLFLFTFTSGVGQYSFGELAAFGLLSLLYMMDLRNIEFPSWLSYVCRAVNVSNIIVGIAILAGNDLVGRVLVASYGSFYPELVPNMMLLRKPVLTFATHSAAGLFLYLFFYSNFQAYKVRGQKLFLLFAILYAFLTFALLSNTGLLLGTLSFAQIFYHLWATSKHRRFWASATLAIVFIALGCQAAFQVFDSTVRAWSDIAEGAKLIVTSPDNGFLSRLGPGGILAEDIDYLTKHPFSPVGAGVREGWTPVDMGLMDYLLRGSIVLVAFAYGGLFYFLKRNLRSRADVYFLFGVIVFCELGFSSLTYVRMLYLLPFFVIYLNARGVADGEFLAPGGMPRTMEALPS